MTAAVDWQTEYIEVEQQSQMRGSPIGQKKEIESAMNERLHLINGLVPKALCWASTPMSALSRRIYDVAIFWSLW